MTLGTGEDGIMTLGIGDMQASSGTRGSAIRGSGAPHITRTTLTGTTDMMSSSAAEEDIITAHAHQAAHL